MELAYLWPSFDNGIPLAPQFTPAQRQLSHEMVLPLGRVGALRHAVLAGLPPRRQALVAAAGLGVAADQRGDVLRPAQVRLLGLANG